MHKLIVILLLIGGLNVSAQHNVLSYPQAEFDSDTCCWRKLSSNGKFLDAAIMVEAYLKQSRSGVNHHSLYWHTGQLYAMAGKKNEAIHYFHKTYKGVYKWFGEDTRTWYYYASGTVAFLNRNKQRLSRYLRQWKTRYGTNDINYKALLRLYKHWELPDKDAS